MNSKYLDARDIQVLHEKAGEQYGGLWYAVNQRFALSVGDQGYYGKQLQDVCSILAYEACQVIRQETPNYLEILRRRNLYAHETKEEIALGEYKVAAKCAEKAAHYGAQLL